MNTATFDLFLTQRTANTFLDRPVDDTTLCQLYDLYKWGPTAFNAQPARVLFLRSAAAKARLGAALQPGNLDKTLAAPVVAIVAYDEAFYEQLPAQAPHLPPPTIKMIASNQALAQETAFRNGSLQGAYLIIAARMLGLGAGPMSGFDADAVNGLFFAHSRWKANFLVNLGYADPVGVRPRGPRLDFEQAARII